MNENVVRVIVRDQLSDFVKQTAKENGVSEVLVWKAVRYWADDWDRLLEGREIARELKVGNRVMVVGESDYNRSLGGKSLVGKTGVVTGMEFSRSHGDVALLLFDGEDPDAIPRVRHGVCAKYLKKI